VLTPEKLPQQSAKATKHRRALALPRGRLSTPRLPEYETQSGCVCRVAKYVGDSVDATAERSSSSHRHLDLLSSQLHQPAKVGGSAGEYQPTGSKPLVVCSWKLQQDQLKQFLHPGADDVTEFAVGCRVSVLNPGQFLFLAQIQPGGYVAVGLLHSLGNVERQPQSYGDVTCDLISGDRDDGGVIDVPILEYRDIRGAAAEVGHDNTALAFLWSENGLAAWPEAPVQGTST